MALTAAAEEYFRTMSPLAGKIHEDLVKAKKSYRNIWGSLTEKEKTAYIDETIIKPDIMIRYAADNMDYDIDNQLVRQDNLMTFFGKHHAERFVQDEHASYMDEHSGPFIYQTQSQLNLCVLADSRGPKEQTPAEPEMSRLELAHIPVVNELKSALKTQELLKGTTRDEPVTSPGFISKFMSNFKSKDEERECLVGGTPTPIVASSDNFFRTNFKSPQNDRAYRTSMIKSNSDLSEENRGLLSSSQASSGTDFQSTETLTESTLPKTGYDFLDNW